MTGFYKFLHWAVFRLRIYVAWSWLYNQFRNREYRRVWKNWLRHCAAQKDTGEMPVDVWGSRTLQHLSLDAIQRALDLIEWKEDSWRSFWDAIAWPERMLFWISCKVHPPTKKTDPRNALWVKKGMKQPETEMDCDDFTSACMWMVSHMDHTLDPKQNPFTVVRHYFLNVARLDGKKFWGHNVCLVEETTVKGGTKHPTWWHMGNWGKKGPESTVPDIIKSLRGDLPLIAWAVMMPGNKLYERSGKIPPEDFLDPRGKQT
jgi:hypothetical protein